MGIKKARRLQDLMDRARAVWDFAGAAAGDLPFTAGDVIVVTGKQGEWWQGHLEAKPRVTGSFPANYVERLPADAVASPAAAPAPAAAAAAAAAAALQGAGGATAAFGRAVFASSVASAAPRGPARPGIAITAPAAPAVARGGGGGPTPAAPPVASMTARPAKAASAAPRAGAAASDSPVRVDMTDGPVGRIAVAVADWPAEERGALGLTEGEEVTVTEAAAGGWWRGRTADGRAGFFPATFVTVPSAAVAAAAAAAVSTAAGTAVVSGGARTAVVAAAAGPARSLAASPATRGASPATPAEFSVGAHGEVVLDRSFIAGAPRDFSLPSCEAFDELLDRGFAVIAAGPGAGARSPRAGEVVCVGYTLSVWDGGAVTATAIARVSAHTFTLGCIDGSNAPAGLHAALATFKIEVAAVGASTGPAGPCARGVVVVAPEAAYGESGTPDIVGTGQSVPAFANVVYDLSLLAVREAGGGTPGGVGAPARVAGTGGADGGRMEAGGGVRALKEGLNDRFAEALSGKHARRASFAPHAGTRRLSAIAAASPVGAGCVEGAPVAGESVAAAARRKTMAGVGMAEAERRLRELVASTTISESGDVGAGPVAKAAVTATPVVVPRGVPSTVAAAAAAAAGGVASTPKAVVLMRPPVALSPSGPPAVTIATSDHSTPRAPPVPIRRMTGDSAPPPVADQSSASARGVVAPRGPGAPLPPQRAVPVGGAAADVTPAPAPPPPPRRTVTARGPAGSGATGGVGVGPPAVVPRVASTLPFASMIATAPAASSVKSGAAGGLGGAAVAASGAVIAAVRLPGLDAAGGRATLRRVGAGASAAPAAASVTVDAPASCGVVVMALSDMVAARDAGSQPEGIDRAHPERHLSDADVVTAFSMSRVDFEKLPAWKQRNARQAAGLW